MRDAAATMSSVRRFVKDQRAYAKCPACGGPWGYQQFLGAIWDPDHDEHDGMLEWIGGSFDPEAFDAGTVSQRLRPR